MTVKEQNKEQSKTLKKGLKKGTLEFLLSSTGLDKLDKEQEAINEGSSKATGLITVAIEKIIRSPYQPRKNFSKESLDELSASIKAKGLIQPLIVRMVNDKYELIAGERRWRACQLAGIHSVPVVVKDVDNETALVMAIVENIQREDLSALEEAKAMKRLLDEFSLTQQEVAEVVGRSRSSVTNLLRLLSLNIDVQKLLDTNKLEMGHARALLSLSEVEQLKLANRIVLNKASVRDAEKWVRDALTPPVIKTIKTVSDPNITSLENDLSELLNTEVVIQHSSTGKGRLVINYFSIDELDGIIAKIKSQERVGA
jgi:ParB family chromosome partitioning protein